MNKYNESIRVAQLLAKLTLDVITDAEREELSFLIGKTGIDPAKIVKDFSYLEVDEREVERGRKILSSIETTKQSSGTGGSNFRIFGFKRGVIRYAAIFTLLCALSLTAYYLVHQRMAEIPQIPLIAEATILEYPTGKQVVLADQTDISEIIKKSDIAHTSDELKVPEMLKVKVLSGSTHTVILEDKTKVVLYPGSELTFPSFFDGGQRSVSLVGEGFFEVTRDSARRFTVRAGEASVAVLGTSFNVRAYDNEPTVETSLVSGKVSVNSIEIEPDQMAVLHKGAGEIKIEEIDGSVYTDRALGLFVFENRRLDEIMREFGLWYGLEYEFADDALKTKRFRFRLPRSDNFYYLMQLMEETGELEFDIKGNKIKVLPTR